MHLISVTQCANCQKWAGGLVQNPFPSSHAIHSLPLPSSSLISRPLNPVGEGERCKLPQRVRAEPGRWTIFAACWAEKGFWWEQLHVHIPEKYPWIWQRHKGNIYADDGYVYLMYMRCRQKCTVSRAKKVIVALMLLLLTIKVIMRCLRFVLFCDWHMVR